MERKREEDCLPSLAFLLPITPLAPLRRDRERETTGDESVPNPNQVMSGESSRLPDVLCKVISKVQSLYIKQRFAKGVQRNITDLINNYR